MKIIKTLKSCVGKTIKKIAMVDNENVLVTVFEDETFIAISICESNYYNESSYLSIEDYLEDYLKVKLNIISDEEHNEIIKQKNLEKKQSIRKSDLETLKRLKMQYENEDI